MNKVTLSTKLESLLENLDSFESYIEFEGVLYNAKDIIILEDRVFVREIAKKFTEQN